MEKLKNILLWSAVAVVIVCGVKFLSPSGSGLVGNAVALPGYDTSNMFSTVASRSQKGVIYAHSGKVGSIVIQSDTANLRYFQMFDQTTNPTGASTPLFVFEIPAATASASPSVLNMDNFYPAIGFTNGITWGISSSYGTYASASVVSSKFNVLINWK